MAYWFNFLVSGPPLDALLNGGVNSENDSAQVRDSVLVPMIEGLDEIVNCLGRVGVTVVLGCHLLGSHCSPHV